MSRRNTVQSIELSFIYLPHGILSNLCSFLHSLILAFTQTRFRHTAKIIMHQMAEEFSVAIL